MLFFTDYHGDISESNALWREFSYSYQSSPMEGQLWKLLKNIIEVFFLLDLYLYTHIYYESYKNINMASIRKI